MRYFASVDYICQSSLTASFHYTRTVCFYTNPVFRRFMHYDVAKCHNHELIQTQRLLATFLTLTSVAERVEQGYSNGGPRSESGPLHGDGRTSSASQTCIL